MTLNFQDLILNLSRFWSDYGCIIQQPYDTEKGASTMNPATFLRALGPEPWSTAMVEPCRRPTDARYGENPNRLGHYFQYQVILKPSPDNAQELYLKSLEAMGIDLSKHDVRFVEDNWESPTLGAAGVGWEVWLEDVIAKCIEKCSAVINEKNPNLENKEKIARDVGVGAVIFGALSNNKIKDIVFSYDRVLNFDGETGPYVQYTAARCSGVLAKSEIDFTNFTLPEKLESCEYDLIAHLASFPSTVSASAEKLEPSFITRYAIELAKLYNKFYFECKILTAESEETVKFRLALTKAVRITIENALNLLGISTPERM